MTKKLLDFQANISEVSQVNPLFSTCKVRVLYTGRNRNMSIITKEAVTRALPTLKNIPIVGEFSVDSKDYKGHGGKFDADTYDFIHTTKPYGVVPESATYEWETIAGREYLVISGCYLWTGRYEEAFSVVESGKGQSMEIQVTDGQWVEDDEAYRIDNFIFSALCILGDDVEPAFEQASITAYSLDRDSFKQEFSQMLGELKSSLTQKEGTELKLKELLEKYSVTIEDLTAKGINFSELSEEELEEEIKKSLEEDENADNKGDTSEEGAKDEDNKVDENASKVVDEEELKADGQGEGNEDDKKDSENNSQDNLEDNKEEDEDGKEDEGDKKEPMSEAKKNEIETLKLEIERLQGLVDELEKFKLKVEEEKHEAKVQTMFSNFQLTSEDVKDLDIHKFSIEEIEEKCYAILGRKLANNKNFSKEKGGKNIHIKIEDKEDKSTSHSRYGDLFEKYNK